MLGSKFEESLEDILGNFIGPFPLDSSVIEANIIARPGVYIWCESLNSRRVGYVGKATCLPSRLRHWARTSSHAEFFIRYVEEESLDKVEKAWIAKAGDLNKK